MLRQLLGRGLGGDVTRRLTAATVGLRIREAYLRAGLNRNRLSKLADLDYAQIMKLEKGTATARVDTLERIASVTGFSVADLLGEGPVIALDVEEPAAFADFVRLYGATLRPALTIEERAELLGVRFHKPSPEKYLAVLQLVRDGMSDEPTPDEVAAKKKGDEWGTPKRRKP